MIALQPEAAYWAVLSDAQALPAGLLDAWYATGARSPRDLFDRDPRALAELLERSEDDLAPLLALRARLPQAQRLVERLAREEIELLSSRERRYPRVLRAGSDGAPPPVLWLAGSLDLLARRPIALLAARDASAGALDYARVLARGVALGGRPVLTGVATAIERAMLEAALGESGGAAIAVLNQGIARALPDLRRYWPAVRGGRLLILSPTHPEAPWQPALEDLRGMVMASLADSLALVYGGAGGTIERIALRAVRDGRPVYVRTEEEAEQVLLAEGARLLPAQPEHAAVSVLAPDPGDPAPATGAGGRKAARTPARAVIAQESAGAGSAAAGQDEPGGVADPPAAPLEPDEPMLEDRLREDLLHYLEFKRGRAVSKGKLLQALGVREAELDRALIALIAGGWVIQRQQRAGVGYALLGAGKSTPAEGVFQLSLFGQEQ